MRAALSRSCRALAAALTLAGASGCPPRSTTERKAEPTRPPSEALAGLPGVLEPHRGLLAGLLAPAIQLVDQRAPVVARLGGDPVLPPATRWPASPNGPMTFVVELDFAAIRRVAPAAARDLPERGLLAVFYDEEEQRGGSDPDDRSWFRVVWAPSAKGAVELGAPEGANVHPMRRLGARPVELLPDVEEAEARGLPVSIAKAYGEHVAKLFGPGPDHHVLGYADWLQSDGRRDASLASNGIPAGDPRQLERARTQAFTAATPEWRLLLQIDADDEVGFDWEGGRLYVVIRAEDLAARAFEKAWVVLQGT